MTRRALLPIRVVPAATALVALLAGADTACAFTSDTPRGIARLRPATQPARVLLDDALRLSETVRALADDLASSDVIVHVGFGRPDGGVAASTVFVTSTEHARYVRITIDFMASPRDVIPLLAHELEHALEIARAPEVRDTAGMRRLYARIGRNGRAPAFFETDGAREVERRVRAETARGRADERDLP